MKVKNTEQYVLDILTRNMRAREDDFILYGAVLKQLGYDLKNTSLYDFLANAKKDNVPSFETVTRCRRKLCENNKDLVGKNIEEYRNHKQDEFVEYSKCKRKYN
jgi:uncharacterized protein with PIN domain